MRVISLNRCALLVVIVALVVGAELASLRAADAPPAAARGTLIFADDFSRNEFQEATEEIGNGWGSNSKTRAGGNKQVDLKDGAMHIAMHAMADHAVSVTHAAEFRDGSVELRYMLENEKDTLGLDFADLQSKTSMRGTSSKSPSAPRGLRWTIRSRAA